MRKKLGIGAQHFSHFSNENVIYVDKTEKIYELMQQGKHNFITRPRRFGKSLMLDTIQAIHQGERALFKDTWAYDNIDWEKEKRPVLKIDFTLIDYDTKSLAEGIVMYLEPIAKGLGIDTSGSGPVSLFRSIIEVLGQEKEVVILIDEYEMAIADFVGNDEKRVQDNIFTLKKFYATMKGAGCFIHSSYITGVILGHNKFCAKDI